MRTLSYLAVPFFSVLLALGFVASIATIANLGAAYLTLSDHLSHCDRSAPVSCVAERSTIEE